MLGLAKEMVVGGRGQGVGLTGTAAPCSGTPPPRSEGRRCAAAQTASRCAHSASIAPSGCFPAPVLRSRYTEGAGEVKMAAPQVLALPCLGPQLCPHLRQSPL